MNWFKTDVLSEALTRLYEPQVHQFFRANFYHLKGEDADLIVDFGMGLRPLLPALKLEDSKPILGVATHIHVDHVGSFHEFDQRFGHEHEADAFSSMDDIDTLANFFRSQVGGVSEAPDARWDPKLYEVRRAPLTTALREGSSIDIGSALFRVLHLPGHSPGSIALLDERDGVLFSGDAIYEGTLVDDLPGCDKAAYRNTMRRLSEMDVRIVYGGHGQPMSGKRMQQIAREYLDRPFP